MHPPPLYPHFSKWSHAHLEPLLDIVEGLLVCDVVDYNNAVGATVVAGGDGPTS